MEWGTYKPNQFFGIKNRDPNPITVGMLWAVPDQVRRTMDVRHTYKYQSGDGIIAYYEYHDGWSLAREIIEDPQSNARIEIDFIKTINIENDQNLKSQWKALVTIKALNQEKVIAMNPFFYLSTERRGLHLQQIANPSQQDQSKILKITHQTQNTKNEVEFFEFRNVGDENAGFTVQGVNVPEENLWNVEEFYKKNLKDLLMSGQSNENDSNFISIRIPQPVPKDFKFMISYQKKSYKSIEEANKDSVLMKGSIDQLLEDFETQKKFKLKTFDFKFSHVFNLTQSRFESDPTLEDFRDKGMAFSKEALANLLGGIGYYYGPVLIKKKGSQQPVYDEAAPLFTGSPSRSRFPRGFLWDEGFHLMVTCQWSELLCMDILQHWFNSMKPSGWIPREQIRGPEAESAVPREFIVQDPQVANPPSMMFPMKHLIKNADVNDARKVEFLKNLYKRWQKWYDWFFKSQENPSIPNTFSWRGRTSQENLPSGLDDYPRAYVVNEGYEIHLDLQSWMVEFSKFMASYAQIVGDEKQQYIYQDKAQKIEDELHDKLYNKNIDLFCDYAGLQFQPKIDSNGYYAEPIEWRMDYKCGVNAKNSLKQPAKCNHPYGEDEYKNMARCCRGSECVVDPECNCPNCEYHTSIDDDYNTQMLNQFSLHQGIINFFPMMFGLIKDKHQIDSSLKVLADQNKMLGYSGIRSLSKEDQFFLHGSNYWRGAVWINVNYLVLKGLFQNYQSMVPFIEESAQLKGNYDNQTKTPSELYQLIRYRLIKSVYQNWKINHLFYEQYDQANGLGLFTNPFTGWTTLILLITSEKYV